jgi:single-stranded DNA-specific DHH superfamily exonuclease
MTKINAKQAKAFLNSISKKDNVAVIHDSDLDGYASGVLFYSFAKNQGAKVKNFMLSREQNNKNFLKKLSRFNKFIICDLPPKHIAHLYPILEKREVFFTDHHPTTDKMPKNILDLRTSPQGYIPSSRTAFELIEMDQWKGVAGTISDAGHRYPENDEFLKAFMKKEKTTVQKFLKDVVFTMNKLIIYNHKNPRRSFYLFARLKTYKDLYKIKKMTEPVEREIQKHMRLYKEQRETFGKINLYKFNPKYPIKSSVTSALSFKYPKSTILLYLKQGDQIRVSARSTGGTVNVNKLLVECIKGLEGASAGGHDRASGAVFKAKDLHKFKKNLKGYAKKLK